MKRKSECGLDAKLSPPSLSPCGPLTLQVAGFIPKDRMGSRCNQMEASPWN